MQNKSIIKKIENLPVPILTTMVGAATLSNIYLTLGYTWIRHIIMLVATIVLMAYIVKIVCCFNTFKKEYSNTVPASIYAGFSMITMILGGYYFDFNPVLGKGLWFTGVFIHAVHILVFTYRNVIKGINMDTFVPSWFVTYNGIMVSIVVGGTMNEPLIGKIVLYYGICVFALIIPFMINRLKTKPIKDGMYHTQAILLAPSSLCVVCYLNLIKEPNPMVIYVLYAIVFTSILFVLYKIPKFFAYSFTPGFAALTFPMAIGIVASVKMAAFVTAQGQTMVGAMIKEISGIQIYITTGIIAFVLYNFLKMFFKSNDN